MNEKDEIRLKLPEVEEMEEFDLEDILKEFAPEDGEEPVDLDLDLPEEEPEEPAEKPEEVPTEEPAPEEPVAEEVPQETAEAPAEEPAEEPAQEPKEEPTEEAAPVGGDTVRLDDLAQALKDAKPQEVRNAAPVAEEDEEDTPVEEEPKAEPFSEEWEPEYEQPMGDYVPPEPIVFRPKSRLRELKKKLVAGPERRYYELSEIGVGKLQLGIFLNLLIVLLAAGSTVFFGLGMVQDSRMKLLIFLQVLVMLLAGLLGSHRLIEGGADLVKKKFTLNTLLLVTFLACCADGVFCLMYEKMPCCAAFSLEMLMCQWSTYHKRVTEMGQMDTLRKATMLDGLVRVPDYYEGRPGFLRKEGQVEDFMDHYQEVPGPEKVLNVYTLVALAVCVGVGVTAGLLHDPVLGVRAFAAALLAGVPVTMFITLSRPMAILEKRLHKLGTVLCGWRGVKEMNGPVVYPLDDEDLFPSGSTRMNGVKFYGDRDPDEIVAYTTALICANGGGLEPLFTQLLDSRNGYHYDVENLQCYGNGGIGGEVCGEPVLVGVLSFLQDMGVEMPEGTKVSQAVYTAIDGQLCGVFAITYGKVKSSAAGLTTLCSYRGLRPVLISGDFMLTDSFLRSKFSVKTRPMAFPSRGDRAAMADKLPPEDAASSALTTHEGLAPMAYALTGARAVKTASTVGMLVHMIGGILGLAMMLTLAILGAESLLTPMNLLLYELIWMIPGLLISEWTRSV